MRWHFLIAGLIGFTSASIAARGDDASITILFHVRPPYSEYDAQHQVRGLLVAPVVAALQRAGLTAEWIETPAARQTEDVKRDDRAMCGLGWFKRPEREAFAQFTDPIYRDQPSVVVARKDDNRFIDGMSLHDSFSDASRVLIVKTGYSYGAAVDAWIRGMQPNSEASAESNGALLNMIAQKHGDYLIIASEEGEHLLGTTPDLDTSLRLVTLSDAPDGEFRYLMCSKSTPPELIERINAGLRHPS